MKFNRWLFPRRSALFKRTRTKILLYFHETSKTCIHCELKFVGDGDKNIFLKKPH